MQKALHQHGEIAEGNLAGTTQQDIFLHAVV